MSLSQTFHQTLNMLFERAKLNQFELKKIQELSYKAESNMWEEILAFKLMQSSYINVFKSQWKKHINENEKGMEQLTCWWFMEAAC